MKRQRTKYTSRTGGHDRGFTLLEVLISITLISVLVVIMAGAIRLAYRSIDRGEQKSQYLERLKVCFALLDAQIQSALPLTRQDDEAGRVFFEGSGDSTRFASNYSLMGGQRGYVIAAYKVKPDGEDKFALYIEENNIGVENVREVRLLEGMKEVRFEFFRKESDADEVEGEWVKEWTDELLFPRKIRVHLVFGDHKLQFTVPVRAQKART